ncbi:MAG: undecaprenyl-phosphate glucose phosphotransferase, partial [Bacteroidota bacterium]|nr:undecaprenyl-phosphate glucose phosphotransferase [Bacteroidota bacterium]
FSYEFISILKTLLLNAVIITFIFFYFYNSYPYPRTFVLLYTGLIFLLLPIEKFFYKQYLMSVRSKNRNLKKVLIVGAGNLGMSFYKIISANKHLGYELAGFVDDTKKSYLNGEYLGKISELENILAKTDVEDVVIALPSGAVNKIEETVQVCEKNAKRVRIIPNYSHLSSGNFRVNNFGDFPLITIRSTPLDDAENQFFKRIFDVIFSVLLFITIFSWLFPLIAFIIKLTSRGPIFFKQERWGLNNKKITCYKFRSMVAKNTDLDTNGKYNQASKNDPRITKIGRFLRKTNIDELPQFFNVLQGDMSVVGPRPHPIPLNLESKETVHNYMLRHIVKPGITGWAQVNGFRGETKEPGHMQNRVNLDLWYIDNWSFWLDCQIIFQTVMNMIKGDKNAY